jgi:hypothetical protein
MLSRGIKKVSNFEFGRISVDFRHVSLRQVAVSF